MREWYQTKAKLPPDCLPVLLFCPLISSMAVGYLVYDKDKKPLCYFLHDWDEYEQTATLDDVTHWMFLPEMPRSLKPE